MLHTILRFGISADIGNAKVSKLNAFQRVAIGGAVLVQRGQPLGISQNVFHAVHIADAGGDIGTVPETVFFGIGQIILPQVDVAGAGHVDRRLIHRGGKSGNRKAADHYEGQQQGKNFLHAISPFRFVFLVMIGIGAAHSSIAKGR